MTTHKPLNESKTITMNQYDKPSPFMLADNNDALATDALRPINVRNKKRWINGLLILAISCMLIQICYFIVRAGSNRFLFEAIEAALTILSVIIIYTIITIKKESNESKKEVIQLKKLVQNKNRSLEDLVLLSELQQNKLMSTSLLKEKLISIVSHDMRVPLNAFKKLISDYENGKISSRVFIVGMIETKNELTKIDDATIDMLTSSEKENEERGEKTIGSEKINEIIESTLMLYKRYAKNKKIDIIPYVQLPMNTRLCIPVMELEIILRSLISNAIKFSNHESIIIITLKTEPGVSDSVATLSVKDFGKGMRNSTLELINGKRAVTGISSLDEGSVGIGLRIVFDVINNNNLQYNIESCAEKGTKFSVKIPLVTG